ncbi:proline-specific peptidase [Panus rudis PR-1116 ss-1]|nr:proline-specific peptidase [Panus rudis PR-1116 ss-1]
MSTLTSEGAVAFDVPAAGKPCETHYWVHGDTKSGKTPLIVLHGGPGATHLYVEDIAQLNQLFGIPVIFYDQIGNGQSTHLPEKKGDEGFWTVQLFIDELNNLISELEIKEFDILGHSWGGMLAASFAITQPKGLRRLVLSSGVARMQDWVDSANRLKRLLPQDVQDALDKHEAAGTIDDPEYEAASTKFNEFATCRVIPWPEGFVKDNEEIAKDPTVYHTMNGPTEFHITGSIKSFDITADLHKIIVPTLLTNGRWDGASDTVQKRFFLNIPKVKWVNFGNSSHTPHYEEPERYMDIVGTFLTHGY